MTQAVMSTTSAVKRKCAIEDCWHTASGKSKYCDYHKRIAREKWLQMIAEKSHKPRESAAATPAKQPVKQTKRDKQTKSAKFERIWQMCCESAELAAAKCKPTPMVVQQHFDPLDDSSPVIKQWVVNGGVCGFAVVKLPLTHPFTKYLIQMNRAYKNTYGSGATVRRITKALEQSYERNCAAADAFANTLAKHLPTLRNKITVYRRID